MEVYIAMLALTPIVGEHRPLREILGDFLEVYAISNAYNTRGGGSCWYPHAMFRDLLASLAQIAPFTPTWRVAPLQLLSTGPPLAIGEPAFC